MRAALVPLCLLIPLGVASASPSEEHKVANYLRGMAHRSSAIVDEARARYAKTPDAHKRAPLEKALTLRLPPKVRAFCAEELGRMAHKRSADVLLKSAIRDPDAIVRGAAADALRRVQAPDAVRALSRTLRSRLTSDRIRAAHALGRLGDVAAVPHVLYRWSARSGDFPRVYFQQVNQLSYIQDFDVEVASTSFIADPFVSTIQDGSVQAVKVLATEITFSTTERLAYQGALQKLTGQKHKTLRQWRGWWKRNAARLTRARAAPDASAPTTGR